MYALGVDPALSAPCGLALLDFSGAQPRLIEARSISPRCGGDWQRRADDVLGQIEAYMARSLEQAARAGAFSDGHFLVCYELPHLRPANSTKVLNPQTALKLADLGGGARGLAVALGLECIGVQATEAKVALCKRSDATKEEMIAMTRQAFGVTLDSHAADAVGVALAGMAAWHRARLVREASDVR